MYIYIYIYIIFHLNNSLRCNYNLLRVWSNLAFSDVSPKINKFTKNYKIGYTF